MKRIQLQATKEVGIATNLSRGEIKYSDQYFFFLLCRKIFQFFSHVKQFIFVLPYLLSLFNQPQNNQFESVIQSNSISNKLYLIVSCNPAGEHDLSPLGQEYCFCEVTFSHWQHKKIAFCFQRSQGIRATAFNTLTVHFILMSISYSQNREIVCLATVPLVCSATLMYSSDENDLK